MPLVSKGWGVCFSEPFDRFGQHKRHALTGFDRLSSLGGAVYVAMCDRQHLKEVQIRELGNPSP